MGFFSNLFGPPTPDQFAQQFMEELRRQGFAAKYDPEGFSLRTEGEAQHLFNLRNFYQEHCRLPRSERAAHLRRSVVACLTSQRDLPEDYEDVKPDLRIKLWCRATLEKLRLRQLIAGKDGGLDLPVEEVGGHLFATVVYDYPSAVRSVSNENLAGWGVSVYEALEVARHNLAEDNSVLVSIGESLYSAITGDSYDSSRLLLTDQIRKLQIQGALIAMVPNRDTLLVTGSNDDDGLKMMLDFAEKAIEDPRPMMFMPLRLEDDTWHDWMPPREHALFDRFQTLETRYLYPEYQEQKALLEALHKKNGTNIFVASYTVVEKKDGTQFTYALWSKGSDTLLPKAQKIIFFEDGKEMVAAGDWDHVAGIVGDLMEPTDDYPPRFRVREFPTEQQLAAIGLLED